MIMNDILKNIWDVIKTNALSWDFNISTVDYDGSNMVYDRITKKFVSMHNEKIDYYLTLPTSGYEYYAIASTEYPAWLNLLDLKHEIIVCTDGLLVIPNMTDKNECPTYFNKNGYLCITPCDNPKKARFYPFEQIKIINTWMD